MIIRDKLNTIEGYQEIIDKNNKYIVETLFEIQEIGNDEKNNIQKYPNSNLEIIKSFYENILNYKYKVLKANYSIGNNFSTFTNECLETISFMEISWKKKNGYVEMVWMLSIGIMLEIPQEEFDKLIKTVESDNPNDYLIDLLIAYRKKDWQINKDKFMFPKPYKAITEIVELAQIDKQQSKERLQQYLKKEWYRGHSDTGWYGDHKSQYNVYSGYWSFESGALVKILGLNDNSLKDQQYYPYDMAHWKE